MKLTQLEFPTMKPRIQLLGENAHQKQAETVTGISYDEVVNIEISGYEELCMVEIENDTDIHMVFKWDFHQDTMSMFGLGQEQAIDEFNRLLSVLENKNIILGVPGEPFSRETIHTLTQKRLRTGSNTVWFYCGDMNMPNVHGINCVFYEGMIPFFMKGLEYVTPLEGFTPERKDFICLNRNVHAYNRRFMLDQMYEQGLDKFGHVSDKEITVDGYDWAEKPFEVAVPDFLKRDLSPWHRAVDFSVVCEDGSPHSHSAREHFHYVTEKTWRAVYYQKPFMLFAQAGTLKSLRNRGFYVFDDIFDTSYDDVFDDRLRALKILEQVKAYCEKSQEDKDAMMLACKPKVEHNYQRLMEMWHNDY